MWEGVLPTDQISKLRAIGIRLGRFTWGDLVARKFHQGAIRNFVHRQCREVGARIGSSGRTVRVFEVMTTQDEELAMRAHNAGMSVGELLEDDADGRGVECINDVQK